jgi:transposase
LYHVSCIFFGSSQNLDKARKAIQKHLPKDIALKLKGLRWVLLKSQEDLDDTEKQKLQALYEFSPMLRKLHQLKERFRSIFEHISDRNQAERFLQAWVCEVKQFGSDELLEFVKTLESLLRH